MTACLRHLDNQVLAAKGKARAATAFHVFRAGLGQRRDDDGQRNRGVTVNVGGQSAAGQLAVDQRFVERDGAGTAAGVWRVGGELNRVLVPVDLLMKNVRRHFGLANETLGDATADVNYTGDARPDGDLGHVQHVLHDVELKVVLLFES